MKKNFKISFKQLVTILILIFLIIIFESLKYLIIIKDTTLINEIVSKTDQTRESFIVSNMLYYFYVIINFIMLALFSYFTRNKVKISSVYKATYFFVILLALIYEILLKNIYYNYIAIILEIILLIYVLSLKEDKENKYGK